jgi:hypothetical protein
MPTPTIFNRCPQLQPRLLPQQTLISGRTLTQPHTQAPRGQIVDDNAVNREGFRDLLSSQQRHEAHSSSDALELMGWNVRPPELSNKSSAMIARRG